MDWSRPSSIHLMQNILVYRNNSSIFIKLSEIFIHQRKIYLKSNSSAQKKRRYFQSQQTGFQANIDLSQKNLQEFHRLKQNASEVANVLIQKQISYLKSNISVFQSFVGLFKKMKENYTKREQSSLIFWKELNNICNFIIDCFGRSRHQYFLSTIQEDNKVNVDKMKEIYANSLLWFQKQKLISKIQLNENSHKIQQLEKLYLQIEISEKQWYTKKCIILEQINDLIDELQQYRDEFDFINPENNTEKLTKRIIRREKRMAEKEKICQKIYKEHRNILEDMIKLADQIEHHFQNEIKLLGNIMNQRGDYLKTN